MYQTTLFTFADITSESMGVTFCRYIDQSIKDIFVSGRDIVSETIQNNNKYQNYLYKINKTPHTFKIELYHENLDNDKQREIARWFFDQQDYKPFIPTDTNRVYYILVTGEPEFTTNGTCGIISFDVTTQDSFSYSNWYTQVYDLSTSITTQAITIENLGDIEIYPYIKLKVIESNSTITLTNSTNAGKFISFGTNSSNPLVANENIEINTDSEIISTDQLGLYRYSNLLSGSEFFGLVRGNNNINVSGKAIITMYYQYKYLI